MIDVRFRTGLLSAVCLLLEACANTEHIKSEIVLEESTTQIEGWLVAQGEWKLFATHNISSYDPYSRSEGAKCVTLIKPDPESISRFAKFNLQHVIVTGVAIKYESLQDGTSEFDRALFKKYYEGQRVDNFCLRSMIFVTKDIRLK